MESTLAYSLNSRNVPTLVVEMGVGMRITTEYGNQMTDGIFRLMKELGIWDSSEEIPVRTPIISREPDEVTFLNAPVTGVFIKEQPHGSMVKKGMVIGRIVNPLSGEQVCEVVSPVDGWLFTVREYPIVDQGSLMARILSNPDVWKEGRNEACNEKCSLK